MTEWVNGGSALMHRECLVRMVAGSVTHIRGECTRRGGHLQCLACEEGLTKREAARRSFRALVELQLHEGKVALGCDIEARAS